MGARQLAVSSDLRAGASAPPAYAGLLARVAHLQEDNRRLRRRLGQAKRERSAAPLWVDAEAEAAAASLAGCGAPVRGWRPQGETRRRWPRAPSAEAPARAAAAGHDTMEAEVLFRSELLFGVPALSPPPPEGDTEAFLRYLDVFRDYAGALVAAVS